MRTSRSIPPLALPPATTIFRPFHKITTTFDWQIHFTQFYAGCFRFISVQRLFDPSISYNLIGTASVGISDALLTSENEGYQWLLDAISRKTPHLSRLWTSVVSNNQAIPLLNMALQDPLPTCLIAPFWTNTQSFIQVLYHLDTTNGSVISRAYKLSISSFYRPQASVP